MTTKVDLPITPRRSAPSEMSVAYATTKAKNYAPGRRVEIKYRDLGVQAASNGDMRAEVMEVAPGNPSRPTGWHYHECDMQFLMMVKGWVRMEFPDLGVIEIHDGDTIMIPGGTIHQELASSDPMELLEISIPAKLGTVNVPSPEWAINK